MFARIVVPLDGSGVAEQALPTAADLARLAGAPLLLVQVVDVTRLDRYGPYALAVSPAAFARVLADEEASARAYLEPIALDLTARGLTATVETRRGQAARELVAATRPDDLVVMATHGRGGPSRWLLGSVAELVTRRAPVPVMLVRAESDPSEPGSVRPPAPIPTFTEDRP